MNTRGAVLAALLAVALLVPLSPVAATAQQTTSLAPYVPTPQDVVHQMLELAGVTKDEFLSQPEKQDAVIRRVGVIGEAAKNLPRELRDRYSEVPNPAGARFASGGDVL